jgi:hypothetical protein
MRHPLLLTLLFTLGLVTRGSAQAGGAELPDVTLHVAGDASSKSFSQVIETQSGIGYQLRFKLAQTAPAAAQTVEAMVQSGGHVLVDTSFDCPVNGNAVLHTATFVAQDITTTITFNDLAGNTSTSSSLITVIDVLELPPYQHSGHYTGTLVADKSFPEVAGIHSTSTLRVNARINAYGQMFLLLEPGDGYATGTVNNDGDATYHNNDSLRGSARYTNGILRISFSAFGLVGSNFATTEVKDTITLVLRRIGP